jgi:hypothetical protein
MYARKVPIATETDFPHIGCMDIGATTVSLWRTKRWVLYLFGAQLNSTKADSSFSMAELCAF